MEDHPQEKTKNITLRLVGLAKPYSKELILGMIFLIGGSGINLLFPEIIRRLLDPQYQNILLNNTALVVIGLIFLIALQGLCFYGRSFIFGFVGHKAVAGLRKALYGALINQDVAFFDRNRAGDLVSRLASDTVLIQTAVSLNISVFIRYAIQVVVGIILMIWISPRLTLVILVLLPILVGISIFLGKKLRIASKKMHSELGQANMIAEETLYGIRTVKAFTQESNETARYGKTIDNTLSLARFRTRVAAFFASFSSALMNISIVTVLWIGIAFMKSGVLSLGDLTAFLLYGVLVAVSFAFLASNYAEFAQALGATERVFEILDQKAAIESAQRTAPTTSLIGNVEFMNVTFSYPTRSEEAAVRDISFEVNAGSSLALVGPSGGGKSTIVNLLLRFYDPQSGTILIDDKDIKNVSPYQFRKDIAIVAQDPEIFSVTVAEILRYGKPEATDSELRTACQNANLLEFIESLPQKFATHVGDKGVQLSGGQKQRLAIARAMLKNPKILILDEATSALDSANEELVQSALQRIMRGRTTIVIAHRLSTVKNVDRILVISDGRIVEKGSHEELIKKDGLYKDLVEKQNVLAS